MGFIMEERTYKTFAHFSQEVKGMFRWNFWARSDGYPHALNYFQFSSSLLYSRTTASKDFKSGAVVLNVIL
jgi:hypothetical protein